MLGFAVSSCHLLEVIVLSFAEEAHLQEAEHAAEDNCGEDHEDEGSRDNNISILKLFLIDLEHQTKSNSASDHAGEPDEDLLAEGELAVVSADFQKQ